MNNAKSLSSLATPKPSFTRRKLALAIAAQVMACSQAFAAPSGGVVVGGAGVIEQAGKETTITQGTDKLAIDWNSFNVNADERVQFIQPTQSSIALNRILGTNGSQILGQIDANGHVVLVNPNGIFFGKTASVNVGGLIASGLQIKPEDFINGDMVFKGLEGTDGAVINTGLLNASLGGNVTLLGKSVENRGLIVANMGRVNLVAGEQVVLTFDNQGLLGVQVDEAVLQDELSDDATVKNSGDISAESGQILLSASKAQDVFTKAVNHGGVAKSVVYHDDGSFTLGAGSNLNNTGTLNVSGVGGTNKKAAGDVVVLGQNITNTGSILANIQNGTAGNIELHSVTTTEIKNNGLVQANATQSGTGGDVKLQGKNIGLFDNASVSVTGEHGGGQILIGGDREGLNSQIKNADFVYISDNTNVKVDAISNGNAGKLITFAEDTARIYGHLSARGGAQSGDGGFIETSGKRGFEIDGAPDIAASNGKGGHWLIDPYNVLIGTSTSEINNNVGSPISPFTSTGTGAEIRVTTIQAALNAGNVTIQTGAGGSEEGNITVGAEISFTANRESTLNLIAHNSIFIDKNITAGQSANRKLNINLTANTAKSDNPSSEGSVIFKDGVYISTSGGDFKILSAYDVDFGFNAATNATGASINLWGADYYGGTSNARYMAPSGSVHVNASHDVNLAAPGSTAIPDNTFVSRQPFLVKGKETLLDVENKLIPKIQIEAGNDITFNGWLYDNNANEVFNGTTVSTSQFDGGGYTTLKLTAGNNINFNGSLDRQFTGSARDALNELDALKVVLQAGTKTDTGAVIFKNNVAINTGGADFTVSGKGNLDLTPITTLKVSSAYGPGSLDVTSLGDVKLKNVVSAFTGDVYQANGQNDPSTTAVTKLRVMDFTATAGGILTLSNTIETFSGNITLSGNSILLGGAALNTYTATPFAGALGNITLKTSSDLALGTVDALGDFSISAKDVDNDNFSVTQSGGSVAVNGKSVFDIGGSDITLRTGVKLLGDIQITSARNADFSITSPNSDAQTALNFNLTESTVSGDFNFGVNNNGNITSSGPIVVGGTSTFYAVDNNISLGDKDNDFGGAVFIGSASQNGGELFANNVSINDINDLVLGNAAKIFKNNQDLSVTAGGDITQVGVLDIGGNAIFSAGAASAITLNSDNLFNNISIPRANSASITNSKDLRLGNIAPLDSLSVTLKSNIANPSDITPSNLIQSTASTNGLNVTDLSLNVSGTTTLDNGNNELSTVSGTVNGGTLTSKGDLNLGAFTLNNDFTIDVSGEFTFNSTSTEGSEGDISNFTVIGNSFVIGEAAKSGIDTFTLTGSDGTEDTLTGPNATNAWLIQTVNSTLTLADKTSMFTFNGIETVQGGTAVDVFVAGVGANGITVLGGNNTDIAVLDSLTSATGDNVWSLAAGTSNSSLKNVGGTLNFNQIENLVGGGTTDELTGPNANTVWQIGNGVGAVGTINFSNMTKVTGGSRSDRFQLAADANITSVLDGGSGNNTLEGKDEDTAWNITGVNAGSVAAGAVFDAANTYVASFVNIQNLIGQSKTDNFFFNNASAKLDGLINGGAGTDSINYSQRTDDLNVKLGFNSLDSITGIEQIIGNNKDNSFLTIVDGTLMDGSSPILNSATYKNDWTLNNPNAGQVVLTRGDADATTTITFSQFGSVAGETVVDNFTFTPSGTLSGNVDGDALNSASTSINSLISPSLATVWTIGSTNNVTNVALTTDNTTQHITSSTNIQKLVGSAAQDIFTFTTQTPVQIDGGSGLDADGLEVQDQITFASVTDDVSVSLGGSSGLSVNGVEQLIGNNSGAGVYNSQLSIGVNGNNTWVVNNTNSGTVTLSGQSAIEFSGFNQLGGGSGNDRFTLSANIVASGAGTTATVSGGAGVDTFDINTSISALISGDTGNDIFNIKAAGVSAKLDGNANSDTLNAFAGVGHRWAVNDSDSTLIDTPVNTTDLTNKIIFNGMEKLNGTAVDVDTVAFSSVGNSVNVTIDAGDAEGVKDVISYANVATDTTGTVGLGAGGLIGFESIQGNGGELVLQGSASATPTNTTEWAITKSNTGTVTVDGKTTEFEGFAHLLGAAGLDNFTFAGNALVKSVDGGEGINAATLSGRSSGIKIDLTEASSLADGAQLNLANIATVTANAQFANELMSAADNSWTINGLNIGVVNHGGVNTDFVGFNQLSGKAGVDNFVLGLNGELAVVDESGTGVIAGTVDGGLGVNRLTAPSRDNVWTITENITGVASGNVIANNLALNFSNIQTLVGGSANDTLNATNTVNTWTLDQDFAGDVNELKFSSMNVLVGGNLADQFNVAKNISQGDIFGGDGTDTVALTSGAKAGSIQTGAGEDSITLTNANIAGLLDGGAGDDVITFIGYANGLAVATESNVDATVTVFNFEQINVNGGTDYHLLGLAAANNIWNINGPKTGTLNDIGFSGFDVLQGGSASDDFKFSGAVASVSSIDGGLGDNSINIAPDNIADNKWIIEGKEQGTLNDNLQFSKISTLIGGAGTDTFDFSGIEETAFTLLDGAGGEDRIIGMNVDTNWVINDVNTGYFNSLDGSANYTDIENFSGGDNVDNFTLNGEYAYATGIIDGGDPVKSDASDFVGDGFFSGSYSGERQVLENTGGAIDPAAINVRNFEVISVAKGFSGGPGSNIWEIVGPNSVRLNGGTTITSESITGGSGDDLFIFTVSDASSNFVNGGEGNNTIQIDFDTSEHVWGVTGDNAGLVIAAGVPDADGSVQYSTTTLFENIQNLVGSKAIDRFLFADTGSIKSIDGGLGNDIVSLVSQVNTNGPSVLTTLDYNITLKDNDLTNASVDEVRYSTINRVVDGVSTEVVGRFSGIDKMYSGNGNNQFFVNSNARELLQIDAGEGEDLFDTLAWDTDTSVLIESPLNALATVAGNGFVLTNFDIFSADAKRSNTFTIMDGGFSDWRLTQNGSGRVSYSLPDVETQSLVSFNGFQTLIGGSQGNSFDLNGFVVSTVKGGLGFDALIGGGKEDTTYAWSVTDVNSGSVLANQGVNSSTLDFEGIDQLVGGEGKDTFMINDSQYFNGLIDGRGGNDALTIKSNINQNLHLWVMNENSVSNPGTITLAGSSESPISFANIDVLNAGSKDSLQGANAQNTWNFTESNNSILTVNDSGLENIITFSGFNHFIGGDNIDAFNVASMADMKANQTWIDGGASIGDVLNITDTDGGYSVALYDYSADQGGIDMFVTNVESLKSVGLNSLWGGSAVGVEYSWQIDAKYHGYVNYGAGDTATKIEFSQFDTIFGGDSNDLFQISSNDYMEYIYGGAGDGEDLIDFSQVKANQIIEVNSAGTASGVSGIEGFVGNNDGSEDAIYQSTLRVSSQSSDNSTDINVWTITDINDGTFVQNGRNEITFRNFNHLLGGKGNDEFTIAEGGAITGTVAGAEPGTAGGFDTVIITGNSAAQLALVLEQDLAAATDYSGVNQARNDLRKTAPYADLKDYTLVSNIDSVIGNATNTTLYGGLADNDWQFAGTDRGSLTYNDGGEKQINFEKVANIQGNNRIDHFTFNGADKLTGWLSGGAGEDSIKFDFSAETPILIAVADMQQAVLQPNSLVNVRNDIELVTANSVSTGVGQNTLLGTAANNEWLIDGENSGRVNGVAFVGFDSLTGNAQDDLFTIVGTGRLSGKVDGAEGNNSVDAHGMAQAINIAVGMDHPDAIAHLQIENIQSVAANTDFENTLIGANAENIWRLEDPNQGSLGGSLAFFGFSNLVGGDLKDSFIFSSTGALSGYIDGGLNPESQRDSIDYSQLSGDVQVAVASFVNGKIQNNAQANAQSASIINIELVKGNSPGLSSAQTKNNAEIIAADFDNTWSIRDFDDELTVADGLNDGQVHFNNTSLAFVDFSTLTGGAKSDTFNQLGGVVSGIVDGAAGDDVFNISTQNSSNAHYSGGDGNDVFNYTLASSIGNVQTYIDGGNGTDSVFVNGVAVDFSASYRAVAPAVDASANPYAVAAVLSYQEKVADAVVAQSIEYKNLESFQQGAKISSLTIEGSNSETPDHIELNDGYFTVNDHTLVAYNANTPKITLNAGQLDIVSINQSFSVLDTLTLNSGKILLANPEAVIDTTSLVLNAVSAGEDAEGASLKLLLNTNITNLSVNDVKGAVEIVQDSNQANPLVLQTISNVGGAMSIRQANGNVEQAQTAKLDVKGLFSVNADNGDINLSNPTNHLTGEVALSAKDGNVSLANDTAITLTGASAENLTLIAEGNISSSAPVVARASTTLSAAGDITLTDFGNRFSKLKIEKAKDVNINTSNAQILVLDQAEVTGDLILSTDDLLINGPIHAQSINVSTTGSLEVGALSGLQSNSSLILHTENDLDIKADLQAVNDIDISVDNGSYYQAADISTSQGNVQLHVKNEVFMEGDTQIRAAAGDVIIDGVNAGEGVGKVSLGQIVANTEEGSTGVIKNGLIKIVSRESVIDNNGSDENTAPNIVANQLVVRSALGIGVGDAIETQVLSMDVVNSNTVFDAIQLDNKGSVDIVALWANGNIDFKNEGDVTVTSGSINAFYDGRPLIDSVNEEIAKTLAEGRRREFSKLEPNIIGSSELSMTITSGGLRMKGAVNENNPDIAAYSTEMSIEGDIGDPSDPHLVLYIPQDFSMSADRRWKKLVWAFGLGFPDGLIEENVTPVPTIQAGEQLIAVEELEEVDPAVFTSVKNYYYNEISILLPQDQRYEDEDEE